MVSRKSLPFSVEKCDGHGLRGLTATRKKDPRHQDSSHDQMSEATHRLDPDEVFPAFVTLGISD